MQKLISIFIFISMITLSSAQDGLGYYCDYYNHFYVFDKGNNIQVESNPVDSIKTGDDYIAYINQAGNLRVYYNGQTETVEEDIPTAMIATANALVYKMNQRLMIYKHGKKTQLASWVVSFYAADSIVTWQEERSMDVMAYQNGEIKTVEGGNSVKAINNGQTGKNLFAYNDMNNQFKIFYNNLVYDTKSSNIREYSCGLNTVAFIDRFNNTFNVFYKGEVTMLSEQAPKSFAVADNMVCYIDPNGSFMIYLEKKIIQLESYTPTIQNSRDNIIEYYYEPELKIIYDATKYKVDKFIPQQTILLGPNSALYMDSNNRPKYFYKGKTSEELVIEQVKEMHLNRDLPVFTYGNSTIGFYYNGKLYEYETSKQK